MSESDLISIGNKANQTPLKSCQCRESEDKSGYISRVYRIRDVDLVDWKLLDLAEQTPLDELDSTTSISSFHFEGGGV